MAGAYGAQAFERAFQCHMGHNRRDIFSLFKFCLQDQFVPQVICGSGDMVDLYLVGDESMDTFGLLNF